MIGGIDVVFHTKLDPAEALDLCVRAIVRHWPKALFQDATSGTLYTSYASVPFERSPEFMIYLDRAAFESWEKIEADPSNHNTMIHVLSYAAGQATVVADDTAAQEMQSILRTIWRSLQDKSIRMGAQESIKEAA
jgi:hypothetical protein